MERTALAEQSPSLDPIGRTALTVIDLGLAAYGPTLDLQKRLVERVKASEEELAFLILVEHDPPVVTLGRSGKEKHLLLSREELARRGFEVFDTNRGGDATYHGPGQIVGYPILRVDLHGRDAHRYLRDIEEVLIRTLARFGVEGRRVEGMTGVWAGEEKIAATGVAISRWVSYHGFALNVSTDLSHFGVIVPCGIVGKGVTSLSAVLGRRVAVEEVKPVVVESLEAVFGFLPTERRMAWPEWQERRALSGREGAGAIAGIGTRLDVSSVGVFSGKKSGSEA